MQVGIVTVGDELLSGDTTDTNGAWLAERLTDRGVAVERITTVPDRIAEIADVVRAFHDRYDATLVTGGVGPTHDDVTMEGVAAALDRGLEPDAEALAYLTSEGGYAADELDEGTVDLPAGARPLHNEVGVAPGCVVDTVYVFPGVPHEMRAMFESVADDFAGTTQYTERVETPEPESHLLDRLAAVRERFDVSVGSYPGEYVTVKFTASDEREAEAAAAWFRERVESPG
ncbi:MAG: competence/damage-inducible protein A [Halobaculum sp.]